MRRARWLLLLSAMLALVVSAPAALAQETPVVTLDVGVTTRFPGVDLGPGDTATFPLQVSGPDGERVALEIIGVPEGWTTTLRGNLDLINEVIIDAESTVNPTVDVEVPDGAADGDYTLTVVATAPSGEARLELHVRVTSVVGGGIRFYTDYPGLSGAADDYFAFTLRLLNDTPREMLFGLTGEGPAGWVIDVRPSQQTRASTVTLGPGETGAITVNVDPPDSASAGEYTVIARAEAEGEVVEVPLVVEITGNYDLGLSTSDGLLNFSIEAGASVTLDLVLVNNGTAPLSAITFQSGAPADWDVAFGPESVEQILPGGVVTVTATVTAAGGAVAGDYALAITARSAEASANLQLRASVETSALWGLLGIAVIVVALGALGVVFWRFGRR